MHRFPLQTVPLVRHKKTFLLQNMNFSSPPKHTLHTNLANKIRDQAQTSSVQLSELEDESEEMVKFSFVTHEGEEIEVEAECGENIMVVGQRYEVFPSTCNAGGECTICHVYVEDEITHLLSEQNKREEEMLDNTEYSKPNSRLCCYLSAAKKIEGARFHLPKPTKKDGYST
ncbi:hypothetical protein JTE90_026193 [Oedothorax gibbosus]|uniref:2Fe-2S ferredoxin-type domain-containing protein n=1 Tax=Oedothorax gibbosus TaxID=931172 RepID=A0AAV6U1X1_9ARAC|nr:hypothetical protein JTE90_026193 [Oedothorax gibbosus]